VTNVSTTVTIDLIDVITVTTGPIVAMTIGIDVITAAMIDMTTIVAMITTTDVMTARVIAVMTSVVTAAMIDVMIDNARMTTIATTTTARSDLHHHHLKGQPQRCIPVSQSRDQLHRWWPPSDQKQQAASIKRKGDRVCQH
jgi:hypothetical protein